MLFTSTEDSQFLSGFIFLFFFKHQMVVFYLKQKKNILQQTCKWFTIATNSLIKGSTLLFNINPDTFLLHRGQHIDHKTYTPLY